jgi:hypothetical protein
MQLAFRILDLAARLLLALGVGCLLLGRLPCVAELALRRDAERATGEVVSYHELHDGSQTRYRPRVRFKTASGEIVTVAGQLSASSQRVPIGAQVPMIYKTNKPTEARVALFTDNWLGVCIALLVGPGACRRFLCAALGAPSPFRQRSSTRVLPRFY